MSGRPDIVLFGDFSPQGGAPRLLANMIPYWGHAGFRTAIVTYRDGVCFYPEEIADRVSLHHLGTRSKLTTLLALWRFLRREQPKALLATSHLANSIVARLFALPGTGTRRLGSVHNTFGQSQRQDTGKRARKLAAIRRLYRHLDGVIAVSQGVRRDLVDGVGLRSVPVHAIPNGVVTPGILERARESVPHPWLGPDRDEPVVLSVGRLAKQKDQATLLAAVAEVRRERPCRLVILGDGPLKAELRERARELGVDGALDLPGFVDNPFAWMARADCFALSSRWEGFGNVLAEALALGVPVVSTDCPSGPAEILDHGRFGQLAPVGDWAALATAIGRVLAGEQESIDSEQAVEPFTAANAAKRYLEEFGLRAREALDSEA